MWAEIIDLCDNYEQLTGNTSANEDVRNYYLSDALIQMPLGQGNHYYDLLQEAVFKETNQESACYITQMTKAYIQDGNSDHAVKFFNQSLKKLQELKENREEYLLNLYDAIFGESTTELSYEEFKEKYLKGI